MRQLGHFGFGRAHLQLSVVLLDFLANLAELVRGVLDLLKVVAVGFFVRSQLLLIGGQLALGLLQLERELGGGIALAGLQVSFGLGFELLHMVAAHLHLAGDALHQGAVGFQTLAAFFELFDRRIVFILHLGDRVGFPKYVGDLVQLRAKCVPELTQDQAGPPFLSSSSFYYYDGLGRNVP